MLGYVRICKGELKVKEYELYRGLYCSLCKALGKEYGQFSRLLLSYDVTFLVLLLIAVKNISPEFKKGVCPFNLTKKCNYCTNSSDEFSYAAAITMMLFFFKVKDNISDSSFFKRLAMYIIYPYAKLKFRKAAKKYPELAAEIAELMVAQAETEKTGTDSVDEAADASATALGKIFSFGFEDNENLYRFGYSLGRWVYLTDAADDIKKDIKTNSFNVFVNRYNLKKYEDYTEDVKAEIKKQLNLSLAPAANSLDKLGANFILPILENIIYEGSDAVMKKIINEKESL